MSVAICQFFLKHGYCTLGHNCVLYHARTQKDVATYNNTINDNKAIANNKQKEKKQEIEHQYANVTEICFSFDTTGSMSSYLKEVRKSLQEIVKDLFRKVPNIRISIIAHGDYCDKDEYYVIKYVDFTRNQKKLINFVQNTGSTYGGDEPECYELALYYAAHKLKWTKNAQSKALVIIGDASPHEADYDLNTLNINWRKETELLRMQSVTIYGIFCGDSTENKSFYKQIAKKTNGKCLELSSIKHICKLFVALCLRTSDDDALFEQYTNQILRSKTADDELSKAIMSLSSMQKERKRNKMKIDSAIKRLMYDLKEIKRENLIDLSVVPESDNVFKWHCNIKNVQGLFTNVYIHLTLDFPIDYPAKPPTIKLVTPFPNNVHPNITDNTLCLPLFGADNYNTTKSKYGSCWSAVYSIISLLVNIGSIFGEIEIAKKGITKKEANKLLRKIRGTHCSRCGHSHNTPYPVLGANKLPFEIEEMNVNEEHYKCIMNIAKKEKNKGKQEQIVTQERNDRARGVLIAGNIIETVKNGILWKIKSKQSINRNYVDAVSWQFTIDMFERKSKSTLYSHYIFGFVNNDDVFFGVDIDGNIIFDNNIKNDQDNKTIKIKSHDVMTYVLYLKHQNGMQKQDELYIFINYRFVASVSLPTLFIKCDIFYPVMYVQDIRLHLTLDNDPKLLNVIKKSSFAFNDVFVFNKLQSNYLINTKDIVKDQTSWNELLVRSLSSDILLDIFTYLTYSDLVHCKEVNTFWYSVLIGHNVLDRTEIRCFYTHESIDTKRSKCILGVGLNVTRSSNKWITSVETEMDFLSLSAYKEYNIYNGAWAETITHFIPLIINEKHGERARKCLLKRLSMICDESTFNVKDGLMVVTAIMNQFVVQLMANTIGLTDAEKEEHEKEQQKIDPKHASEKALIGYCAFHHMLLYLVFRYPEMKKYATECITKFISDTSNRKKSETPDLGKFILNLAIVDEYEWEDIASVFIDECLDRQVRWYLKKYPKLEYLDETKCSHKERIACTLKSTMISRRLVTFQVFFLKNICKQNGYSLSNLLNNYNKRWGQPTNEQKNALICKVHQILLKNDTINSWLEYFENMGIKKYKTNIEVCNALKKAVVNSKNKEYHRPNQGKMRSRNKGKSMRYSPVPSVSFSMKEAKLNITDTEAIEMQGELNGHNGSITCIKTMLNDANKLITASRDKSILIWDLNRKSITGRTKTMSIVEGKMVRRLKGHNHFISDIDISSDGNYVLSASWDGLLRLWNTNNGAKLTTFVAHQKDVLSVQFSKDNRHIISCGRDKTINLWNTLGEIKQEINRAHNGWITCVKFSPNPEESIFVSASYDKKVKVWQFDDEYSMYKLKFELVQHTNCITAIAISPDGSLSASGDKYGVICLWDIDGGKLLSTISVQTNGEEINCIVFSPNRYWLCVAVGAVIEIWDLETKGNIAILRDNESLMDIRRRKHFSKDNICNCIEWSHDGKTLYSGYSNNKIRIWQIISQIK